MLIIFPRILLLSFYSWYLIAGIHFYLANLFIELFTPAPFLGLVNFNRVYFLVVDHEFLKLFFRFFNLIY